MYAPALLDRAEARPEAELAGAALVKVPLFVPSPHAHKAKGSSSEALVRMLMTRSLCGCLTCGSTLLEIFGARRLFAGMTELMAAIRLTAAVADVVA